MDVLMEVSSFVSLSPLNPPPSCPPSPPPSCALCPVFLTCNIDIQPSCFPLLPCLPCFLAQGEAKVEAASRESKSGGSGALSPSEMAALMAAGDSRLRASPSSVSLFPWSQPSGPRSRCTVPATAPWKGLGRGACRHCTAGACYTRGTKTPRPHGVCKYGASDGSLHSHLPTCSCIGRRSISRPLAFLFSSCSTLLFPVGGVPFYDPLYVPTFMPIPSVPSLSGPSAILCNLCNQLLTPFPLPRGTCTPPSQTTTTGAIDKPPRRQKAARGRARARAGARKAPHPLPTSLPPPPCAPQTRIGWRTGDYVTEGRWMWTRGQVITFLPLASASSSPLSPHALVPRVRPLLSSPILCLCCCLAFPVACAAAFMDLL